jgi:hypothetical protein
VSSSSIALNMKPARCDQARCINLRLHRQRSCSAAVDTSNLLQGSNVITQDTPRSDDQFGSLVVCLPVPHTGGDLLIRHNRKIQAST